MNLKKSSYHRDENPIWDFWAPLLLTFTLYFGIRTYVAEARYIPSGSMLPGLQIKDRLLIEKITYRTRKPKRGEIVVFNSPYSFDSILSLNNVSSPFGCSIFNIPFFSTLTGLTDPACDAYIKRVVAIGGDKVIVDERGRIKVNGDNIIEPYSINYCLSSDKNNTSLNCPYLSRVVPSGHVFVLGDNRMNSWDGRFWPGGGFLPIKEILGRAVWRFWPLNRVGTLRF